MRSVGHLNDDHHHNDEQQPDSKDVNEQCRNTVNRPVLIKQGEDRIIKHQTAKQECGNEALTFNAGFHDYLSCLRIGIRRISYAVASAS